MVQVIPHLVPDKLGGMALGLGLVCALTACASVFPEFSLPSSSFLGSFVNSYPFGQGYFRGLVLRHQPLPTLHNIVSPILISIHTSTDYTLE